MQTIVTAIVNPEKALDAYTSFLKLMLPEYEVIRDGMDQGMMDIFHKEQGTVFRLSPDHNGWTARQEKRD